MDFEALVQYSTDILAVIDRETRLLFANPAAERILGMSIGEHLGRLMSDRVHPDDLPAALARLEAITSGSDGGIPISLRVRDVTGAWKVIQVVATSRLDDPAIGGIVINGRDATEYVKATEALEHSLEHTIQTLVSIVELRDRYTAGHQGRVALLADALAQKLGLDAETTKGIWIAASIHDLGKIAVPVEILNKPGHLSGPEFALIKVHPLAGHDLLADIEFPWPIARMVLEHHERQDGSGYPSGSAGDDILFGSRVLAVADVVEAMTVNRPYALSSGLPAALAEIRAGAGTRYDPTIVGACLALFEEEGFRFNLAGPGIDGLGIAAP